MSALRAKTREMIFKRSTIGVYQHWSSAHFKRYLAEFDFRYNRRERATMELAYRIKRAAKELLGYPQSPRKGVVRPTNFEEQIYRAAIEEGDICFDVGANVGDVAIFLARIATPRGCVVAFEPVFGV
jgi:hypothetical protein